MKTNNREFIYLKYLFCLVFLVLLFCLLIDIDKNIVVLLSFISLIIFYIKTESIITNFYQEIRHTIQYAQSQEEFVIKDGDLGLLYDEMRHLKRRTKAYEETVMIEKNKLKQTIEDICHQLKTPLASISIYTELLIEKDQDNQYLIEIDQQLNKMNHLIYNLLKLAKFEFHQVEFEFHQVSIREILNLSIQSLNSLIRQTQIPIKIGETSIECYCDESWLQEAFSNIIKNSLEQDCQNIHISFEEHKQYIKVFIHNNGPTIEEKDLPHIFERFYHTSKQQGVGIGLALSKEIMKRHHGDIIVYNQEGVVFEVILPRYNMNRKYKVS